MSNLSPNNYQDPSGWPGECYWCGGFDHASEDCPDNPVNAWMQEMKQEQTEEEQ